MQKPVHSFLLAALLGLLAVASLARPARAEEPAAPSLIFPFPEGQTWLITCGYALSTPQVGEAGQGGCGHSGHPWNRYALDLQRVGGDQATQGQPVWAAAAGRVLRAGWQQGLGWHVLLDHGGGYTTAYAHFREPPIVREGDDVQQGRTLGFAGCTGLCTGAHIHFVLWKDGVSVLPEPTCGQRGLAYGQRLTNCAPSSPLRSAGADFNGDGRHDLAFFYEYGPTAARIHLLTSDGAQLVYSGPEGWWRVDDGYSLRNVVHAFASDFNGDGRTDLAALSDEPDCRSRVHVFLAAEGRFADPDPQGWWQGAGYCARSVPYAAAGDFDGDGLADIALFYQLGLGEFRLDVLRSSGASFEVRPEGWWRIDWGYWLGRVTQLLPGDFNGDGRTDVATLYDYGGCQSRVHLFLSTGDGFRYSGPEGWWRASDYCARNVRYAAAGDFDGDGANDDLAFLYDEGSGRTRIDVLRTERSRFLPGPTAWWDEEVDYPAEGVRTLLPGDFDGDGRTDLAALDDDGNCFVRLHVFLSQGDRFLPPDAAGWWATGGYCAERVLHAAP